MRWVRRYRQPVGLGLVMAGLMFCGYVFLVAAPRLGTFGFDAFAFWNISLTEAYARPLGSLGSFNYAPPVAFVFDWFSALDWWAFLFLWTGLMIATVIWIGHSPLWVAVAFSVPFVAVELYHGNIHILLAAAILLGFRHPWTWAFVLLTKPSAGVGLLWFVVRGEWRNLLLALATTALLGLLTYIVAPHLWAQWFEYVLANADQPALPTAIPVPLWMRLPIAACLVIWGARTDRRWTVVVGSMLALPVLWIAGLAMLIGVIPDVRHRLRLREQRQAARGSSTPGGPEPRPRTSYRVGT